jgi:hypothetical protein
MLLITVDNSCKQQTKQLAVISYFGEWNILVQKVKIVAKPVILQKILWSTNVFIGAHFILIRFSGSFGTPERRKISLPSREWELIFFAGVGLGSGLPQMLIVEALQHSGPSRSRLQVDHGLQLAMRQRLPKLTRVVYLTG